MSKMLIHVSVPGHNYRNYRELLCGITASDLPWAHLWMILEGDSGWYWGVPHEYKRCERCAKKLEKDHPEVLLIDLRNAML
jgi:hypothetical protein